MSQARGQKGGQPDNTAGQTKANMEKDKLRQGKPHGKSSSKSHLGDAVLDFLFASGRTLRRDNGKMVVVKHREKPVSFTFIEANLSIPILKLYHKGLQVITLQNLKLTVTEINSQGFTNGAVGKCSIPTASASCAGSI